MDNQTSDVTGNRAKWLARHAAALVGAGSFILAWGVWAPLLGRQLDLGGAPPPDFLVLALGGGLMPSLCALIWHLLGGRIDPAARSGLPRTRAWPVWLAVCLAAAPVLTLAGIAVQLFCGIPFTLGDVASRLALGLAWPVLAALGEEFAWRGVILPALRPRFGLLGAALLVGVAWGVWHLPSDWIGLQNQGVWFWPQFLIQGPVVLTSHSLIMAWLWAKTGGRTITAVIYHFGITASAILLGNQTAGLTGDVTLAVDALSALPLVGLGIAAGFALRRLDTAAKAAPLV